MFIGGLGGYLKSPPACFVHLVYLVYLVCLVYSVCLVCLVGRNSLDEPDRPDQPNRPDRPGLSQTRQPLNSAVPKWFFRSLLRFGFAVIKMPMLPVEPGMAKFVGKNVAPSRQG